MSLPTSLLCACCLVLLACGEVDVLKPGVEEGDASAADGGDEGSQAGGSGKAGGGAAGQDSKAGSGAAGRGRAAGAASTAGAGGAGAPAAGAGSGASAAGAGAGGAGRGGMSGRGGGAAGKAGAAAGGGGAGSVSRCGTRGGVMCGANEFCNHEPDADCGATDRGGVCEAKPQVCTDIYAPVCGCDGRTYSSDCVAHAAGVSVKKTGECQSGGSGGGRTCGGIAALECDSKQFCNYEPAAGGQGCDGTIADAAGKCEALPSACTRDLRPVCGCDHRSYNNPCEAHSKGVSVMHDGGCKEKDCTAIGGRVAIGFGPAAMCNANETEHGYVVADDGSMFIEGALCCLP